MRNIKIVIALVAVAAVAFAGVAMAGANCGNCKHASSCMGKSDCAGYDQKAATTFKATVVGVEKEECKGCKMTHVDLVVKMEDKNVTVRLGPAWYMDKQDELLKKNDVVEIYASKVKDDKHDLFVAGKITKGDDVLILRDDKGQPMWQGWRRG